MRIDFLLEDIKYFAEHFPAENYGMTANDTSRQQPEQIEQFLSDGWTKESGVKLSFFEALAWLRYEDFFEFTGFKSFSINGHDSEYTYDEMKYQDWVCDDKGNFDISRYASGVYNIPLRVVSHIEYLSENKQEAAEKAIEYIENYTTFKSKI